MNDVANQKLNNFVSLERRKILDFLTQQIRN